MTLEEIKGVGPKTISLFYKIGINNSYDLITYYPYRYQILKLENLNQITNFDNEVVVKGIVNSIPKINYIKKSLNRLSFISEIDNNLVKVVIFNRAFLKNNLIIGKEINLIGKYNKTNNTFMASNITLDKINGLKIEPIYHLVSGLKNKQIHNNIINALTKENNILDYIPSYLNKSYNFISKDEALDLVHNPNNVEDIKKANLKLIYEELFTFMFKINYLKYRLVEQLGLIKEVPLKKVDMFINKLPFTLTNDQNKAIKDIIKDYESSKRMNRLLLGDVGSGKTIVALIASYINYLTGYQTAIMAPTEILAKQHYESVTKLFNGLVKVELLTGSTSKKDKKSLIERLINNEIDLLIGTHALISEDVVFNNLGLVVTDEQHRFGVNQRNNLQNKGQKPDVIYLSATPIPRTYALTLYGDMDISIIKDKPKGRKDIITIIKPYEEMKSILELCVNEVKQNHQIYVVAPLIDENEELNLNDVNALYQKFNSAFNNKIPIGVLHGKLKQKEKDAIMNEFKENKIKLLISTTVIEVGIDVANATMMIIFNAERFGLATMHQLRGRVGRSELQSKCILIGSKLNKRLQVLEESNDGFYISEKDFEMRGEGDLFGIKQSGDMLFKIASLQRDIKILLQAKKDSLEFVNENISNGFSNYPEYQKIANNINIVN